MVISRFDVSLDISRFNVSLDISRFDVSLVISRFDVLVISRFDVSLDISRFDVSLDISRFDVSISGLIKILSYKILTLDSIFSTFSINFFTAPYNVYLICVVFKDNMLSIPSLSFVIILVISTAFG